jgi:hypothetical protein
MGINVSLTIITDTPSRLVVGTCRPAGGIIRFLGDSARPDLPPDMIEGWDFDCTAGVLRVVPVPGSAATEQQFPLESLTRLTWGGLEETMGSEGYCHYDVSLVLDDGRQNRILSLPGSSDYLCGSLNQAREVERRLRAFLKPVCPRLETSTLEDLAKAWDNPIEALALLQGKMGRLLADMDRTTGPSRPIASHAEEPGQPADPTESVRELVTQLHAGLGNVLEAAARNPRLAGSPGHPPAALQWLILRVLVCVGVSLLIGLWFFRR